jgi:GTP-binding protein
MPATIAIVGRPNVGKSTLFNRLTGTRRALAHDLPGVTRDRVAGEAKRPDGGVVTVVDTGGFEPESEELIPRLIRGQVLVALREANAVVLVVDAAAGLTPADEDVAAGVRRVGKPVVVAANKTDRRVGAAGADEFAALGFEVVGISAEHGRGIGDLWEALAPHLPPPEEAEPLAPELAVAIVGRPNVGKSSLVNRLLGGERVLVSAVPGTTRDAVDTLLTYRDRTIRLVDTAGIRRRGRTETGPEVLSVVMARKAIERADVCVLMIDAAEGLTAQDTHVAGLINDAGRAVVVAINKADLIRSGVARSRADLGAQALDRLKFLKDTPIAFISAHTGEGVGTLLPRVLASGDAFRLRMPTGELNRVLRAAWERQPPPGGRRPIRLYYATQTGSGPPRVALFTSTSQELHFSYQRYLENALRAAFPLAGAPLRFIMRVRHERSS